MKRTFVIVLLVALVFGVGGYFFGSSSRNSEVAALNQKLEKWESRETQLKLREARAPQIPRGAFPKGYPKIVEKSEIPENLQDQVTGKKAAMLAPGVWADLPPGADIADATTSTLFGYCSSIKSYERMYTPGTPHSNTCV